jgi:hypothetical protein
MNAAKNNRKQNFLMRIAADMTSLSVREIRNIQTDCRSAADVYRYLTDGIKVRTFREVLCNISPGPDLKEDLIAGLCEIDNQSRESISRNVRNWLSGKHAPSEREDLIKICFALKLNEIQSSAFLSLCSDGGFHIRNPRELVFEYCLRTGRSWRHAHRMASSLRPLGETRNNAAALTKTVAHYFRDISSDEAFRKCYEEHYDELGELHNTAYVQFTYFWDLLSRPDSPYAGSEEKYSTAETVDKYLRMKLPLEKRTAKYSLLQKTIRKYWPNTTNVTRILSREEDVTRRILLLLYLVTEGGITEKDDDAYLLDEDMSDLERFEEHFWRLNAMLTDCGFGRIDPRNVFDWLILHCLRSGDDESMSDRMQAVLDVIFDTETG